MVILFAIIGIGGIAFIALLWGYLQKRKKKQQERVGHSIYREKRSQSKFFYGLYLHVRRIPVIRDYLQKISRRFEIVYPGEEKEIGVRTIRLALTVWGICGVTIIFLFLASPSFYHFALTMLLIWVFENEIVNRTLDGAEERLLKQLDIFLTDVRHYYHIYKTADDAVLEAMEHTKREMRLQADAIYRILTSEDMVEEMSKYNAASHNKFLKMFLAQCCNCMEYGDKIVNGQSLFLQNLMNLKTDLRIDILRIEKVKFIFSFAVVLIVFPVCALEFCSNWAIGNLSTLHAFYSGKTGILVMVGLLLETALIYYILDQLKHGVQVEVSDHKWLAKIEKVPFIREILDVYCYNNYGEMQKRSSLLRRLGQTLTSRQLLLKQMITALLIGLCGFAVSYWMHTSSRNYVCTVAPDYISVISGASENEILQMQELTLKLVDTYKNKDVTVEKISEAVQGSGVIRNTNYYTVVVQEVAERNETYRTEYFQWYELFIILIIAYMAFWLPYWMILYRKRRMQAAMEEEVIQYQSIILMMMHFERITTLDMLEMLERFAGIFRSSIQECINEYGAGDVEALEALKEAESFEPFQQIIDNFIVADKIGIEKAFDEIAADRLNFQQKRQQDNEIALQQRAQTATMLSLVPILSVMFFYLIGPFVIASIQEYRSFSEGLTTTIS